MLHEILLALQYSSLGTGIRESALVFPIVMSLHLTGMALFGGMILMVDMRLLGWSMTQYPVGDLIKGLRPWKHLGLTLVVTCGFLLFSGKAAEYWENPFFKLKVALLALVIIHALFFRKSVYKNADELDRSPKIPLQAKRAAIFSLILWIGLVSAGRLIGYYEAPRNPAEVFVQ